MIWLKCVYDWLNARKTSLMEKFERLCFGLFQPLPSLKPKSIIKEEISTMSSSPFIIHEQQFQRIKSVLARLCVEAIARVVLLIDRDGQPIAFHGDIGDMDTTSFASLAAGNVAATSSMAKLIGENSFPTLSHEGEKESIYICVIGRALLVAVFDERSTLGLVKLRAKRASHELANVLEEILRSSESNRIEENNFFAEITDEDIDSLFS